MNELALFAGAGGGILGGKLLGWRTICAVEIEPYPTSVLIARQNDKILPPFPVWDDIRTFDGKPWRGIVDVVSGGFPCQDISSAGKGAGITGARSGLWKEMARIIGEVRPRYVFVENSPMLTTRGLGTVLGDLASMGFDAEWGVLSAADVGAPHLRERIWILGYSNQNGKPTISKYDETPFLPDVGDSASGIWRSTEQQSMDGNLLHKTERKESTNKTKRPGCNGQSADSMLPRLQKQHVIKDSYSPATGINTRSEFKRIYTEAGSEQWSIEPDVGRVANGVAARMDRLKAIGNGQVPLCAATAFRLLSERLGD